MKKKTEGAMLRCKVNWHLDGEKPTKYFLNLEKRLYNKKIVSQLKVGENLICDSKEI